GHVVGQRHLLLARLRLDDKKVAIDTLDLPDHGHALRLRRNGGDRERGGEDRSGENACSFHVAPPFMERTGLNDTRDRTHAKGPPDTPAAPIARRDAAAVTAI